MPRPKKSTIASRRNIKARWDAIGDNLVDEIAVNESSVEKRRRLSCPLIKEEISEEFPIKEEISEECDIKEEISEEWSNNEEVSEERTIKENLAENIALNHLNTYLHIECKDQTSMEEEFDVGYKSTDEADIIEDSLTNEDQEIPRTGASILNETIKASKEINVCNNAEVTIGCTDSTNSSINSLREPTPLPTPLPSTSTPVPTERPSKRPKNKKAVVFNLIAERLQAKKDLTVDKYDLQAKTWAQELKELPSDTSTEAIRVMKEVMYMAKKGKINQYTRIQQQNYVAINEKSLRKTGI